MVHSFYSLCRLASLRPSPSKSQSKSPQYLLLRFISSISNPNPNSEQLRLLARRISSSNHLHQLLCLATAFGINFQNPHLHLLNSILHSLSGGPSPSLALIFFGLLHSQALALDGYTFTSALKATSRLSQPDTGAELHSLLTKLRLESDTFVLNSLIHMYSSSGFIGTARKVFDLAPDSSRDIVSWNSLASGYLCNHLYDESLMVFQQMVEHSRPMDSNTLVGALTTCAKIGALNIGRRIHSLVLTRGFDMDSYLASSLITMYSKCGALDHAHKLFDWIPERNTVCWTAMISGYAQSNQFLKSIKLFRKMQAEKLKPDENTISSVLSSCAQLGALHQGSYVHAYCDINGIELGLSAKNALVDMYSKCGEIDRAFCIFHDLQNPDVFSWTTMISGFAMNGNSFQALKLFSQMEASSSVLPNEITFLGVLSACSHGGLIEEGYYYFDKMRRVYKLLPRLEHYGCMVDLLGRAKLLREAEDFVKAMPIKPDVVIWRSLLFACRINEDVKVAEFAAQRIMELEPELCGGRVMLSNVYAVAARWNDVGLTRRNMNSRSIQKEPGLSFIELNGFLHDFLSAGMSHPEKEIIYDVLCGISKHSTNILV
ncbi:pentatricopeptide repeat-containing protein At4g14820-like [Phalaenopsis equestris]|uniref:pentatricopeptide repeat-containing protein At4g14820-like n=1 Tax=Phalaenopsis equestris TaxID=78828 RepID=UPI0009E4DAD6|nr:pentatricopeptide repeat-containing protein At4g14820-like [Phalaenopsis equestris]